MKSRKEKKAMYDDRKRAQDVLRGGSNDTQQRMLRMLEEIRADVLFLRKMIKEEKK